MSTREIIMASSGASSGEYWVSTLTEPSYGVDGLYNYQAIAVDGSGNIYAAFYAYTSMSEGEPLKGYLVKYNKSGSIIWQINLDTSFNTIPKSIALDSSGNIYIQGDYRPSLSSLFPCIIKLNSSGVIQWTRYYANGIVSSIAIDSLDNIYCFGYNQNDPNGYGGNQYLLVKYNSSGTLQWKYLFNQNAPNDNRGSGVAVGPSGNVYVCGSSGNTGVLIKSDSSGAILWQAQLGSGISSNISGLLGIAIDSSENIFVCGTESSSSNALVAKYNSSGSLLWKVFLGGASTSEGSNAIAVDSNGYIYSTGYTQSNAALIFKLNSSDGSIVWQKSFSYTSVSGFGIKAGSNGSIYSYIATPSAPYISIIAALPNNGYPYGAIGQDYTYAATTFASGTSSVSNTTPSPSFTSVTASGSSSSVTLTPSNSSLVNTLITL